MKQQIPFFRIGFFLLLFASGVSCSATSGSTPSVDDSENQDVSTTSSADTGTTAGSDSGTGTTAGSSSGSGSSSSSTTGGLGSTSSSSTSSTSSGSGSTSGSSSGTSSGSGTSDGGSSSSGSSTTTGSSSGSGSSSTSGGSSSGTSSSSASSTSGGSSSGSTTGSTTAHSCDSFSDYPFATSATDIGAGLPAGYEPSGAVWHTRLNQLFLVSDDGWITKMDADGSNMTTWYFSGDFEGITIADPDSDFVYIGVEDPDGVKEFNFVTGAFTRTFDFTTWMTGAVNEGLEGLTFVNDASNAEGGFFYAGHQGEGKLYAFQLPIVSSATSTSVTVATPFASASTLTPVSARTDISDLNYDPINDVVYVLYDAANKIRVIEPDGTYVAEWDIGGNDQEGLAVTPDCDLFIGEDDAAHDVKFYEALY